MAQQVAAELRVGGPVRVKWPAGNPSITKVDQAGDFIAVWTEADATSKPDQAWFMVLQDFDNLPEPGQLVGETEMPWFGRCRVFRLRNQ